MSVHHSPRNLFVNDSCLAKGQVAETDWALYRLGDNLSLLMERYGYRIEMHAGTPAELKALDEMADSIKRAVLILREAAP